MSTPTWLRLLLLQLIDECVGVCQLTSQGHGELLVSICHHPAASRLTVVVLKARDLPKMDITGLAGIEQRYVMILSSLLI
jgi:hypothetical protein